MLPASPAVLLICAALVLLAVGGFAWAWRWGQFTALDAQSLVIFDADDLRYERPWESPTQRQARIAAYGPPVPAKPGQWGGTT